MKDDVWNYDTWNLIRLTFRLYTGNILMIHKSYFGIELPFI